MVICLERGADLHMAQLMPLPLTVSCFSKIQIGFTFLVPAHLGSPGQWAVKRVCVCYLCPWLGLPMTTVQYIICYTSGLWMMPMATGIGRELKVTHRKAAPKGAKFDV